MPTVPMVPHGGEVRPCQTSPGRSDPESMSVNFLHPSHTGQRTDQAEPSGPAAGQPPGTPSIDWSAARQAGRACCCTARPVVIAIMPPTPSRTHPTDLLLCGHHYRMCRKGLTAVGATVLDFAGAPVPDDDWPPVMAGV